MKYRLNAGRPSPLGATPDQTGVNFAIFSAHAERVELCLFDDSGGREIARIALPERTGEIWHGHVAGIEQGQRYGYRVYGPFDPANGHRFNHHKLLMDPYARQIDRPFQLAPSMFGHVPDDPMGDLSFSRLDSAPDVPKAIVLPPIGTARASTALPRVSWERTILYELHIKGFTARNTGIPGPLRGTLHSLAQAGVVDHLSRLGVTTIEIMPVAAFIDERHLPALGLRNYWGYNPITFMALHPPYAGDHSLAEIRHAIDRIHEAGMEVVIDVVFNHTGESDELGPTISYRGIDNRTYYRTRNGERRFYDNVTGCGNALALHRPPVLRLVMDTMRHWVDALGIDGFRFDLATTLGRGPQDFEPDGSFFAALRQDPILRALKLIAEPWDLGPGGYQGGAFPPGVAEWNDQFRDDVRRFWQGSSHGVARLASRLSGSSDRFGGNQRKPNESINHVTAHDGFTLADLVSYERKHNNANGEGNRDGTDENYSWNNGCEGPSPDEIVLSARLRDIRALLTTLLVARGTPMLRAGDELGQSQGGNNNAYAQDNEVTWIDWQPAPEWEHLAGFVARAVSLRKAHPALHSNRFLDGAHIDSGMFKDVAWRGEDGVELTEFDWRDGARRFLGMELCAPAFDDGERIDHVYVIINGTTQVRAILPSAWGQWRVAIDSADPGSVEYTVGATITLSERSVVVLIDAIAAQPRDDPSVLERLASAAGIEPGHRDANGRDHVVAAATKRALLASMGHDVSNAARTRDSLESELGRDWQSHVPPFVVAKANAPISLMVVVDSSLAGKSMLAEIITESGERRVVEFRPGEGILIGRRRVRGRWRERRLCPLGIAVPLGLHELRLGDVSTVIGAAPEFAWMPPVLGGGAKCWGVSANLYSARSDADWGVGDFTTLRQISGHVAALGGGIVGINPLHALFPNQPYRASPYYPSDRRFLEPNYIDPHSLPSFADLARNDAWFATAEEEARTLRAAPYVNYEKVTALKREAFARAWNWLGDRLGRIGDPLGEEFRDFVAMGGENLSKFAAFHASGRSGPEGEAGFHLFLQWWADRSLAAASDNRLAIGLYRDLAIGPAPDGAERTIGEEWFARSVSIGAPPDPYSDIGQVWGVPPHNPRAVADRGYRPWIDLVRANMRHAGAMRLDHVMGLERLLWVPEGADANDGAYVRSDAAALLAVLKIESHRQRCLIVGEDLGTVPSGFRERMIGAGLFCMSVMLFERDGDAFRRHDAYPQNAVASWGTHDLPPFHGWWRRNCANADGDALWDAVGDDRDRLPALGDGRDTYDRTDARSVSLRMHGFLSRTPSKIALAQLDDLACEVEPVNVPGTTTERPNWRRRMRDTVKGIFSDAHAGAIIRSLAQDRAAPPRSDADG